MATIKGTYKGNLRNKMTHLQSGNTILTDAPTDNHGKGEAFSPTDLACAALAGCMMTIMGISAQGHKFDIDGTTYVYDAEFQHSYPDRNGFGFTYGTSGTWKYANWHRVE